MKFYGIEIYFVGSFFFSLFFCATFFSSIFFHPLSFTIASSTLYSPPPTLFPIPALPPSIQYILLVLAHYLVICLFSFFRQCRNLPKNNCWLWKDDYEKHTKYTFAFHFYFELLLLCSVHTQIHLRWDHFEGLLGNNLIFHFSFWLWLFANSVLVVYFPSSCFYYCWCR